MISDKLKVNFVELHKTGDKLANTADDFERTRKRMQSIVGRRTLKYTYILRDVEVDTMSVGKKKNKNEGLFPLE